jgi:DNA-binding transcriptional MerR regulator
VNHPTLSIGDLAHQCGLSTHALRFYEAQGILQPARRAANGHRRYGIADVQWVAFVLRLKETGMPLADIRHYAELRTQGDRSLQARVELLHLHRDRLDRKMAELSDCAAALDTKMQTYRRLITASTRPSQRKSP